MEVDDLLDWLVLLTADLVQDISVDVRSRYHCLLLLGLLVLGWLQLLLLLLLLEHHLLLGKIRAL